MLFVDWTFIATMGEGLLRVQPGRLRLAAKADVDFENFPQEQVFSLITLILLYYAFKSTSQSFETRAG
jgi:hypothetical protein